MADVLVSEAAIEKAYIRSRNTLGWRLLYSPRSTLEGADIAFVGLNPGGDRDESVDRRFAVPTGSAFFDESWKGSPPGQSRLQKQVRSLFSKLGVRPNDVLAGNLVPFRSPTWKAPVNKRAASDYGQRLWRQILLRAKPRLVIGMGREATRRLGRVLETELEQRVLVGWGNVAGTRAVFENGILVGLPHLSRFPIIGRTGSAAGLRRLFGKYWLT